MIWKRCDIQRARNTPLKPVLEKLGYLLEPRPNGNYAISGLAPEIVVKDHYWVCTDPAACPELRRGGNAIDFLVKIRRGSFHEAMKRLTPPTGS